MTKLERVLFLLAIWGQDLMLIRRLANVYDQLLNCPNAGAFNNRPEGPGEMVIELIGYYLNTAAGVATTKPDWTVKLGIDVEAVY